MGNVSLSHFDYLVDHDKELEAALGLSNLRKEINNWRCSGTEHPGAPLVGCRVIVETSLKQLMRPLPDERMTLQELIDYAEEEGKISRPMALKCHEMRNKGNKGAHVLSVRQSMPRWPSIFSTTSFVGALSI